MRENPSASLPTSTHAFNFPAHLPAFGALSNTNWVTTTVVLVGTLLVLEQIRYRYKKRHLPGPAFTIPIIGKFVNSLYPSIENYCKQWSTGDLSALSVFHIFIVMASTNKLSLKILNSPSYAEPCLVHSARKVLKPNNWVFLVGKPHLDYRKGLNGLFARKAIGNYISIQDQCNRKHFNRWIEEYTKDPSARPIMFPTRHLNMDTSLRVFCGPHIPEYAAQEISDKYWAITRALELVNFPIALPGTKVYRAVQARKVAMRWLELAAGHSKAAMDRGDQPECLLDEWVMQLRAPDYKGRTDFSNDEMAMVVFSFLFASQDAMSSGLVYGFQHLADHPEVLAKVREEQERVRCGDYEKPITLEMLDEMKYLQAVVKESLRAKPPVTMVPYKTTKAFPISEDYTVPAGAMLIPSLYTSLQDPDVFPEPDKFKPERWINPTNQAEMNKHYMVWGSGVHRCIGTEYASMNIALGLSTGVSMMNMEHVVTPESNEIEIIATMFPKDGLHMKITPRLH